MYDLTHASFFSGVGGTDLGLEAAGWRTVSFSEIDPYASAVLAERWPGVPNLGDIVQVAGRPDDASAHGRDHRAAVSQPDDGGWRDATLWSGGFPCQDLSVAGKRAGFGIDYSLAGPDADRLGLHGPDMSRSGLAFAFLDLVERHRPPAILLENVPGLLSSHRGRDFGALVDRLGQLGYGWAYRILDARHFGVPQRRRRVFIVALDTERGAGAERAAAVLSVGTRCARHPATGHPTGTNAADGIAAGLSRSLSTSNERIDADTESFVIGASPDPGGVRAPDGLAGRLDDLAPTLTSPVVKEGGRRDRVPLAFVKRARAQTNTDSESWGEGDLMPTLNAFDVGDARTTAAIVGLPPGTSYDGLNQKLEEGDHRSIRIGRDSSDFVVPPGTQVADDPLLPLGLDSHRYRCCGNGVVAPVAEWIGWRLREWAEGGAEGEGRA